MSRSSLEFLRHIHIETSFIVQYSQGLTVELLSENEVLKRAILRSIEIIGEVAKQVDDDFKAEYPAISWSGMAKMRDKIIHHYFGVDYEIVYDVMLNKIPELHFQISNILQKSID